VVGVGVGWGGVHKERERRDWLTGGGRFQPERWEAVCSGACTLAPPRTSAQSLPVESVQSSPRASARAGVRRARVAPLSHQCALECCGCVDVGVWQVKGLCSLHPLPSSQPATPQTSPHPQHCVRASHLNHSTLLSTHDHSCPLPTPFALLVHSLLFKFKLKPR
jgi:hypothetical protein